MEQIGQHVGALPGDSYTRKGSHATCKHVLHESKCYVWAVVSGNQKKEHEQKSKKRTQPRQKYVALHYQKGRQKES